MEVDPVEKESIGVEGSANEVVNCSDDGEKDDVGKGSEKVPGSDDGKVVEFIEVEVESPPLLFAIEDAPCLACGSNCLVKSEPELGLDWNLNGHGFLTQFCHFLRIRISPVWNLESEFVPICNDCRNQLTLLLDLERRLKELEEDLKNGVKEFHKVCLGAEKVFEEKGIYDKDVRYYRFRRQVVGRRVGRPQRGNEKTVKNPAGNRPRRSLRGPKSVRTKTISDVSTSSFSPVVEVSKDDRAKADHFHEVKSEAISDNENEAGHEDYELQMGSPMITGIMDDDLQRNNADDEIADRTNSQPNLDLLSGIDTSMHGVKDKKSKSERRQRRRNVHKPKKIKKRKSKKNISLPKIPKPKRKESTNWHYLDDFDDKTSDEEDEEAMKKSKKKRQKKDLDYQPDDNAAEQIPEDDNWQGDPYSWCEERTRLDPATGNYTFLHVTFKPMNDGSEKYVCKECDETIANSMFRKHTYRYHSTRFKCKECDHCAGSSGDLKKHILYEHQNQKPINECPICGKPCGSIKGRLLNHITTHYSQQEKEEALARGEKLRMWKDRRTIQCDHCGKKFTSKKELERHYLSKHPKPEEVELAMMYKELCPDCGKFVDRHYMKLHRMRSHNVTMDVNLTVGTVLEQEPQANRHFICTICDRRFYKSRELVRHKMSVHEKNYPFKCNLCPRSFLLRKQLDRHMNTHNNIRPFPCPHCPMAFFTNGNRARHINTYHTDGANPKRKAYVRGMQTKNYNSKRHQPKPKMTDNMLTHDVGHVETDSNSPSNPTDLRIPEAGPSRPPVQETDLIESLLQFQSVISTSATHQTQQIPSTSVFMQELVLRHHQHQGSM